MADDLNFIEKIKPQLLREALTHSSTGEAKHNERLEFLGDAVLGVVISQWLFAHENSFSEGRMSQIRAAVVREESLAALARRLDLGNMLHLGRGEEKNGGRNRASLLADALEALLAAMYLSSGLAVTRAFILALFKEHLHNAAADSFISDYKSEFQEQMQAAGVDCFEYIVVRDAGPDHNKTFWVDLRVQGKSVSTGNGKTIKQAEQEAARRALANRL